MTNNEIRAKELLAELKELGYYTYTLNQGDVENVLESILGDTYTPEKEPDLAPKIWESVINAEIIGGYESERIFESLRDVVEDTLYSVKGEKFADLFEAERSRIIAWLSERLRDGLEPEYFIHIVYDEMLDGYHLNQNPQFELWSMYTKSGNPEIYYL